MTEDINAHLADLVTDVARIRKAVNDDGRESKLTEEQVKSRLSDISNLLDDLYNDVIGI